MKHLVTLLLTTAFAVSAYSSDFSEPEAHVGIGLGIPYGLLGVGVELQPQANFAISSGLGIGFDEPAMSLGVHLIAENIGSDLKPRLSLYASNAVAAIETCTYHVYSGSSSSCEYEQFAGVALGGGFVANGFHLELLIVHSPAFEDRKDELEEEGLDSESESDMALVLGYQF